MRCIKLIMVPSLLMLLAVVTLAADGRAAGTLYVWAHPGLNLRKSPDIGAPVIGMVPRGGAVALIEQSSSPAIVNQVSGYWVRVRFGTLEGWVFDYFLMDGKPLGAPEIKKELLGRAFNNGSFRISFKPTGVVAATRVAFRGGAMPDMRNMTLTGNHPFSLRYDMFEPIYGPPKNNEDLYAPVTGWRMAVSCSYEITYQDPLNAFAAKLVGEKRFIGNPEDPCPKEFHEDTR